VPLPLQGRTFAEAAKKLEVSEQTVHRWRNVYAGMKGPEVARLRELERENARLKKIVAEQAMDIDVLKEVGPKMVGPQGKRRAVEYVRCEHRYTQWRACKVMGVERATARYAGQADAEQRRLVARMHELSRLPPRYGYRRIWAVLRREGWRVQRLWRLEGLKVGRRPINRGLWATAATAA
jgi:DNA-binding XRE family transcriptional regulator